MVDPNSSRRVVEIDLQQAVARSTSSVTKPEMRDALRQVPQNRDVSPISQSADSLKQQHKKRRLWLDKAVQLRRKSHYPKNRVVRLHTRSYGGFATRLMWISLFLGVISIFSLERWDGRENRQPEPINQTIAR